MKLPLPSRLGQRSERKTINGEPMNYEVIDEYVFQALSNNKKAFCLHKLKFDDEHVEFRIAYYMISPKTEKWVFGQFAPMMSQDEMKHIFEKICEKGWI